jgi:hypothetical protein
MPALLVRTLSVDTVFGNVSSRALEPDGSKRPISSLVASTGENAAVRRSVSERGVRRLRYIHFLVGGSRQLSEFPPRVRREVAGALVGIWLGFAVRRPSVYPRRVNVSSTLRAIVPAFYSRK